jgi:hypothetical protein
MFPWHPHGHDRETEPWPVDKDRRITSGSEDPFGVSPECFAAEQLAFVQIREYPKGVTRCAYEQWPPPWWSLRLFLSLKVH